MFRILIVEDDHDLAEITTVHLTLAGYLSDAAYSLAEVSGLLQKSTYDLILLDMLLTDGTGDILCRSIREKSRCPIIFMSCLDDSDTIVSALSSGGDDYVVKPVKYDELLARIEANIRRAQIYGDRRTVPVDEQMIKLKRFAIDTQRRKVLQDGREVELSAIEYALLLYFVNNSNVLLLYEELYNHVWRNDCLGDVRTVLVHISNLRKKIDPGRSGMIETVRGAGYIFSDI